MIFNLYEEEGKYANKNLLNATIINDGDTLDCRFFFGEDYKTTFGNDLIEKNKGNLVVEISFVIDSDNLMYGLMTSEEDEIFDKEDDEYDRTSIFIPISTDTPRNYQYRLSAFYVWIKEKIDTDIEKKFFKGIGHSLLCWIFSETNLGLDSILALEASGDSSQKGLVNYYKGIGFKTCSDISNVPINWYDSASAAGICMYSTVQNLNKICSLKKRIFKATSKNIGENPFKMYNGKKN
jgi:hypothetical protein